MKANELRIGNLVCDYGQIVPVTGFMLTRLEEIERSGKTCINLTPIPLTEEWLLKFGFEKNINGWFRKLKNLYGDFIFTFCVLEIEGDFLFSVPGLPATPLQYVHQLQNLYFALTGEELTVK